MSFIKKLIETVRNEEYIYIQPHNFPDHDAVASAFALQMLFEQFNIKSYLVYEGEIERDSLKQLIAKLNINIKHISQYNMNESHKIVIVDGCKGNKNVTDLIGDEIAVIDHHIVTKPDDVPISDIRTSYGACASIIYSYFEELGIDLDQETATALIIGINMDTAMLTRDAAKEDVVAYSNLYVKANITLVNTILRNYIQVKDLQFYKEAIEKIEIIDETAFCYFSDGCNQNLLGILGDFFLALQEVDFVILTAKNNNKINFSIRNENPQWNAAEIIQQVLNGIGFGGGHSDMAGGVITDVNLFDSQSIKSHFLEILYK